MYAASLLVVGGSWSQSQLAGDARRGRPWAGRQSNIKMNNHTHAPVSNLK